MSSSVKMRQQRVLRPSLEFRPIADLQIDDSYQRSIDIGASQSLVKRIAREWDWGLCQPLNVARREDGALYVIDGQHRLAAARARGDIYDLPCVVVATRSPDEEAAAFVALNQQRRPLTKLDLFKAALAAGDDGALVIQRAVTDAGLTIAATTNYDSWKPMQIANVGGLMICLRQYGEAVLRQSCKVSGRAFQGQVLRYFGTIFPGIAASVAAMGKPAPADDIALLVAVMGGGSQTDWRDDVNRIKGEQPNLNMRASAEVAVARALAEAREG